MKTPEEIKIGDRVFAFTADDGFFCAGQITDIQDNVFTYESAIYMGDEENKNHIHRFKIPSFNYYCAEGSDYIIFVPDSYNELYVIQKMLKMQKAHNKKMWQNELKQLIGIDN